MLGQPSLASVGGGMATGAAFAYPRAADARGSGPSDLFAPNVTQMYDILTQRAVGSLSGRSGVCDPVPAPVACSVCSVVCVSQFLSVRVSGVAWTLVVY